jgi:hypothetical protein
MKITMVKKIYEDGSECGKCKEVSERLEENNEMQYIDHIAYADTKNPESEGYKLADKHNITTAPFFVVEENGEEMVYKTYLQLRKKAFNKTPDEKDNEIENKRKPGMDEMYNF